MQEGGINEFQHISVRLLETSITFYPFCITANSNTDLTQSTRAPMEAYQPCISRAV